MEKNLQLFYQAAKRYRCVVELHNDLHALAIIFGKHRYLFRGPLAPLNNCGSIDAAKNKYIMNKLLSAHGVPVPEATAITYPNYQSGNYSFKDLVYPIVAKPTKDTSLGDDVLCNIRDEAALHNYLSTHLPRHGIITIESFKSGLRNYRVTVLKGKVIGVIERQPANVTGDGKHTIQELIDIANQQRIEQAKTTTLQPIKIDEEMQIRLNELELSLDTIPKQNENITLCYTCNSSRGGSIHAMGRSICKANAKIAIRAANVLGLEFTGLDMICDDINKPIKPGRGFIIECNHNPDITIHETPLTGKPSKISHELIKDLIKRHFWRYLYDLLHLRAIGRSPIFRIAVLIGLFFLIKHFV